MQPTRRRLFALLAELGRPAATAELAARLGKHPNGVRTHLALMTDAGLLVRRRAKLPRGRPRDEWAIAPDARVPSSAVPEALPRWLARAIPPTPARLREVRAAGREIGRELAPGGAESLAGALGELLASLGFRPELEQAPGGSLSCRLRACPYRDSVRENQPVVCMLHRGITEGALDVLAPAAELMSFIPRDPDQAGCELEIAVP